MTDLVQQPLEGHQVLPLNASPLERAMADVAADFLPGLDIPISTLWNPYQCPRLYLPFLAWALSVDVWDEDWPDDVKRRVIADSPMVHRRKGTRWAVQQALKSIGLEAEITEWWETVPPKRRGTFAVTALVSEQIYKGGAVIDQRLQQLAMDVVRASKPKSRIFDFRLKAGLESGAGLACAMPPPLQTMRQTVCVSRPPVALSQDTGLAIAGSGMTVLRHSALVASNDKKFQAGAALAIAGSSLQIIRLPMEISL